MEDSIYTQCSYAARRLAEGDEPFGESDVVLAAARAAGDDGWSEEDFSEADKHAPQVLAALYRSSRLVRFGPVDADAPLTGEPDYVRKAGHILYGPRAAWEGQSLETPNGTFAAITYGPDRDPVFKNGRRRASERDDFVPWAEQVPTAEEPQPDVAALRREVQKLRGALTASERKAERLEAENERLRSQAAKRASTRAA
jgi:hypothetical protein